MGLKSPSVNLTAKKCMGRTVIDGEEVEDVENFVFLGSVVSNSATDVIRRMRLASTAIGRLRGDLENEDDK